MKKKLDRHFHPPAAVIPLTVRAPGGVDSARLEGKVDTGADVSAVPERLVSELGLPPVRTVRAAGFTGSLEEVIAYRMDVEIDGLTFPRMEALATRREYVIVGRNVLCALMLRIDGPRETLEIRKPAPRTARRRRR